MNQLPKNIKIKIFYVLCNENIKEYKKLCGVNKAFKNILSSNNIIIYNMNYINIKTHNKVNILKFLNIFAPNIKYLCVDNLENIDIKKFTSLKSLTITNDDRKCSFKYLGNLNCSLDTLTINFGIDDKYIPPLNNLYFLNKIKNVTIIGRMKYNNTNNRVKYININNDYDYNNILNDDDLSSSNKKMSDKNVEILVKRMRTLLNKKKKRKYNCIYNENNYEKQMCEDFYFSSSYEKNYDDYNLWKYYN